jgi:hypothetical protein
VSELANLFQAKAALAVFDRIEGKPEGLTTVTDAELALLNANQQLSGQMIAQKLYDAAGDKAGCERIPEARVEKVRTV